MPGLPASGLRTIIALSFVLAIGFLLVILSAALFKNYLTLLVVLTYVLAPLPNWLCSRAATHDDFMDGSGSSVVDLGRFVTGGFVAMGIAMPTMFWHCDLITTGALFMSMIGGLLIYGTIISFGMFFTEEQEF